MRYLMRKRLPELAVKGRRCQWSNLASQSRYFKKKKKMLW